MSTLDSMDFKWGENKDANRKETEQEAFVHWKYREAMDGYLLASVTFPDTVPRV